MDIYGSLGKLQSTGSLGKLRYCLVLYTVLYFTLLYVMCVMNIINYIICTSIHALPGAYLHVFTS